MIPFIDANIWVYLANQESPFHKKVKQHLAPFLDGQRDFSISWQVFYEFIRITTDPRAFEKPVSWQQAFEFIKTVFSFPSARILNEGTAHGQALQKVLEISGYTRGHFIHDCHIAAMLYENSIKEIITADGDFRRFKFLTVTDPTG
ncbi:MAG: hypothetical protein ACD_62C00398G0010 [uncultured bacterium]|nr:MAG: hypothetical protein ACD_62C00398G0010 [uncultured bacterium]